MSELLNWMGEHPILTVVILLIVLGSIPSGTKIIYADRTKDDEK